MIHLTEATDQQTFIQRVGQRFVTVGGTFATVVKHYGYLADYPWDVRLDAEGVTLSYRTDGMCRFGIEHPELNLVSEAPDEAADHEAEAKRQHARVKELLGSRLSAEKFATLLNDSETVGAIEEHDIEKRLIKLVGENYHRPDDGDDGHFVGSYLGEGRGYEQHDTLKVAVHLPKTIPFSVGCGTGMVEFVARRIDSEDGEAVVYEVERK